MANELEVLGTGVITTTGSGNVITISATAANPETLTGNTGGAVPATANNINTVGTGSITIAGNPGTSTLTTQLTGLTQHSLQVGGTSATLTQLGVATNGELPIGSTGADPVLATLTAGAGISITNGAGSITITATESNLTFDGDTGSATPSGGVITFTAVPQASSSFSASGSTVTLDFLDANFNAIIGSPSPPLGSGNSGIGYLNLVALNGGASNVACGEISLTALTSGSNNTSIGYATLDQITTGHHNVALGTNSGSAYTSSESSNIVILNQGTAAESNVIRIGTQGSSDGQQNKCFIAGIAGVSVSNAQYVTINTSTGQLGSTGQSRTWTDESTSFSAASNNGYFVTGTATASLPSSPSQGDTIEFIVDTTNVLTIQASTGKVIRIGSTVSAATGTAASNARGDSVVLVYRSSDTAWIAKSVIGTWTVT